MTDFYRFPAMAKLNEWTFDSQAEKVREEANELVDANNAYYEADFEAMDTIHAAENFLRMRGHSEETLEMIKKLTIEKNRKRGYYDSEVSE